MIEKEIKKSTKVSSGLDDNTVSKAKGPKNLFSDWLVMRLFNRPEEADEVCILTTRGKVLARHCRLQLSKGVRVGDARGWHKVPGLRRYRTEQRAKAKAAGMNAFFNTAGYSAIREDAV